MRHEVALRGEGFGLRPVTLDDAEAIVALRAPSERTRFLHTTSPDPAVQRAWLTRYFARPGDWYFAIERLADSTVEGFVGIYDQAGDAAEWGRWVLREGSLAATESALLVYRAAFGPIGLRTLYCRTIADNAAVVSFHDRYGAHTRQRIEEAVELDGAKAAVIEHRFTRDDLPAIEAALGPLASRIASRLKPKGHVA